MFTNTATTKNDIDNVRYSSDTKESSNIVVRLIDFANRFLRANATGRELERMSDRDLADIGLTRSSANTLVRNMRWKSTYRV